MIFKKAAAIKKSISCSPFSYEKLHSCSPAIYFLLWCFLFTVNDLKTERTFSSSKYLEIGQIYSSDKINLESLLKLLDIGKLNTARVNLLKS